MHQKLTCLGPASVVTVQDLFNLKFLMILEEHFCEFGQRGKAVGFMKPQKRAVYYVDYVGLAPVPLRDSVDAVC